MMGSIILGVSVLAFLLVGWVVLMVSVFSSAREEFDSYRTESGLALLFFDACILFAGIGGLMMLFGL